MQGTEMNRPRYGRVFQQSILIKLLGATAVFFAWSGVFSPAFAATSSSPSPSSRFEISFPTSVRTTPITGRIILVLSTHGDAEPRLAVGDWDNSVLPIFGVDVDSLKPDTPAMIDEKATGFPLHSLKDLPEGDYYVQAILNVYTECHRSDGHDVWVHLDQWEGQHFNTSPGNLYSAVQRVHLDPRAGFDVPLKLS